MVSLISAHPPTAFMAEVHSAEIRWVGAKEIVSSLAKNLDEKPCSYTILDHGGESEISILIQHEDLQSLRDIGDDIFILLAEILEQ